MNTTGKALLRGAGLGAGLGLVLFGLETGLLLRTGAVGLHIDTEGPYAALMAAIRPLLPPLVARVAAAYVAGGAVLGLAAGALAALLGRRAWALLAAEWTALLGLLAWDRMLHRPALADDLPWLRPALAWVVDQGAPWHAPAAAAALLALHLGAGAWRVWRTGLPPVRGAVVLLGGAAAAWVVLLSWSARRGPEVPAARHPLVVVIGVDAFRPDRLAALGAAREVAPHIDRLVAQGTLFTRAYTPVAQTEPAWRSLLTAAWPHRTGVRYPLTADARRVPLPTFPEAFARAGWRTVFATDCSRFHYEGADSGFATRLQPPRGAVNFLLERLRYRALGLFADNALGAAWLPEFVDNRALAGLHDPQGYAERLAARLVDEASRGPTLFAFHATAAHFPGDPTYPHYRRFLSPQEPLERRLRMHFAPVSGGAPGGGGASWTREGAEALYDELLAQADAQVGVLWDALERAGLADGATLVLLSDHGESFHADRPELAGATPVHGARLGDEENRILLAVRRPGGQGAGAQVDGLVRLVDVGPTLLELAGLPPLPGADGVSLAPLLRGEPLALPPLYAETGFTHVSPEVFDPGHLPGAPRAFENYAIRPDGVAEVSAAAHPALLAEKDVGAYDGAAWVVDRPQAAGGVKRTCTGACPRPVLGAWLDATTGRTPPSGGARVAAHDDRDPEPARALRPAQRLLRLRAVQPEGPARPQRPGS